MMNAGTSAWGELMKASLGTVQTVIQTNEMLWASGTVIGSRLGTMVAAARDPLRGDYVELGRMIPEKVKAFSEAGNALIDHWSALFLHSSYQAHLVGSLFLSGQALRPSELAGLAARATAHATSIMTTTMETAGIALAPVHAGATANARRLLAGA